ncbi:unnamed protein product [Didymodactylos carnosus]|uniref:Tetraspanin n=1 Tax=Didymodactylos carnosus TaxID=1234261 RepID=A0A814JE91_9BILA|nr:unnamed protein product [Didymodactylos carnosus]CAF1036921.1 unnamed protein product [Didymodactylos carnosus]CAF3574732.1 unnamed protein product [Didymodactylos carnosus]CAF3807416.1 unnamed protein product [Didymodactylos carnosus]
MDYVSDPQLMLTKRKQQFETIFDYEQQVFKDFEINAVPIQKTETGIDEYFIPLEPNKALAFTMNFPQLSESSKDKNMEINGQLKQPCEYKEFDYNCPDCISDMFGPIIAPYAALAQQHDEFKHRLEYIVYQRLSTLRTLYNTNSDNNNNNKRWDRKFKKPLQNDPAIFLELLGTCGRITSAIVGGWLILLSTSSIIWALIMTFVSDSFHPVLTFMRGFSQAFTLLYYQYFIVYFFIYGSLILITGISLLLGAMVLSRFIIIFSICFAVIEFLIGFITIIIIKYYRVQILQRLKDFLIVSLNDYDNVSTNPVSNAWNHMHRMYSCCGAGKGVIDWTYSYYRRLNPFHLVPPSCCRSNQACVQAPIQSNSFVQFLSLFSSVIILIHLKVAINEMHIYNTAVLRGMYDLLENYEKLVNEKNENNLNMEEHHNNALQLAKERHRVQGLLSISPTLIRVKNPRIMNYLGYKY